MVAGLTVLAVKPVTLATLLLIVKLGAGEPVGVVAMKRDLTFVSSGQLAAALGINPARLAEIEAEGAAIINRNGTIREVLEHFNERGDLTDGEWTAMVFALGYFDGSRR